MKGMRREIEFRGYHIDEVGEPYDTSGWKFGSLIVNKNPRELEGPGTYIYDGDYYWKVEEDSIGQYTGSKDRNGVKIYEGDVVYEYYTRQDRYPILQDVFFLDGCFNTGKKDGLITPLHLQTEVGYRGKIVNMIEVKGSLYEIRKIYKWKTLIGSGRIPREVFDYLQANATPDLKWIAEKLGIDPAENVEEALIAFGLDKCSRCGWWRESFGCENEAGEPLCFRCCQGFN